MTPRWIAVLFAGIAFAAPAHAEGFVTPFVGFDYGGDVGAALTHTFPEGNSTTWGVSLGGSSGVFGGEVDFGYAPQFFATSGGDSAVMTLMSNLMLVLPAGPVRPYGVVGLGLIRSHAQLNSSLADVSQNTLGYDIGGGINIFFVHSVGIRGDVRHMHTLQDITLGVFQNQPLDFWRASAGLTLRF